MSLVTSEISSFMANSSWIRKMFEAGIELKKKYADKTDLLADEIFRRIENGDC